MPSWKERTNPVAVGDPVAYSPRWLRSIGADQGELLHQRGVVTAIESVGDRRMATVDFGDGLAPIKLPAENLRRVDGRGIPDRD
jgi:hypothetical protein